jgi:predicted transcriptional regulator
MEAIHLNRKSNFTYVKSSFLKMSGITSTETAVLLTLFKEYNRNFNANSLAKKLEITRRQGLNVLKSLYERSLLVKKQYGKAVFYKLKLEDEFVRDLVKVLLMQEARDKAGRWQFEFREFYDHTDTLIVFGSILKDYSKANDVDLVIVAGNTKWKKLRDLIKEKRSVMTKPIHPVWQEKADVARNLALPDPVLLNSLKRGYILHGYDLVIDAVANALTKHGIFNIPEPTRR